MIIILGILVLLVGCFLLLSWTRLGAAAKGDRLSRIENSPNFKNGKAQNPIFTDNSFGPSKLWRTLKAYRGGQIRVPQDKPPVVNLGRDSYSLPPATGLRITWLGHSSALVEIDDKVILLDPVFSERASLVSFIGPKRFHPVPVSIADLPQIDAVVISHDHYDHLDYDSIIELLPKTAAFYVPLGIGAHLEYWKVPSDKIVAMDWWEERQLEGGVRIIACPARHFSGRMGFGDPTLWVSWALVGASQRVFFSGDTGIMPLFKEVGERFGPFDATLIKVGAYGITWPDIHINPEEAVEVHRMVKGRLLIPVHWGTFSLSYHSWTEPVERLLVAANHSDVKVAIPKPGQLMEPENPPPVERWWADKVGKEN